MMITSKVVIAIGFVVAAETASADVGSHETFETLTGTARQQSWPVSDT
jgi:6,7-dimethyl-8-ribityllumazine synthase